MEVLETLGITSEVICAFFGVIIGWLIGISPSLYKKSPTLRKLLLREVIDAKSLL